MNGILQGTTPSLVLSIPEDVPVSNVISAELVLEHKGTKQKHGLSDVTVDADENTFTYKFSEDETLVLDPNYPLRWQLRLKTSSGIVGTEVETIDVLDLISEEKMA